MQSAVRTYPVFLCLEGRRAVVVGGGKIAAHKASELLESGAEVTLISPEICFEAEALMGRWPSTLVHVRRPFSAGDLDGATIAFCATGNPEADAAVRTDALNHHVLVNIVDVPEKCDFFAGSVVRRHPVVVAIGTGGSSPSLAIALRERIEAVLPSTIGDLAIALAGFRPALLAAFPEYTSRARRMKAVVDTILAEAAPATASDLLDRVERVTRCTRPCGESTGCSCARRQKENSDAA